MQVLDILGVQALLIRTIHHLAATGGTVICKCVAAQPNVCLLSEINPRGHARIAFAPTDPVSQFLARYPEVSDELRTDYFRVQIELLQKTCSVHKRHLVLRDHSHTDYMGKQVRRPAALLSHLNGYEVVSVVTIRDPVDSYLSSVRKHWLGAIGNDFDVYCQRIERFVGDLNGNPVFRYEDFCNRPADTVKQLCAELNISFDAEFITQFHRIRLTGDSGRTGKVIEPRARRDIPEELKLMAAGSSSYHTFCDRFGYTRVDE